MVDDVPDQKPDCNLIWCGPAVSGGDSEVEPNSTLQNRLI
ncbi:hypothetical protein A2U01_0082306, partial [Trifolium medium]|nr:hypothetical protein [Trifolium medium]